MQGFHVLAATSERALKAAFGTFLAMPPWFIIMSHNKVQAQANGVVRHPNRQQTCRICRQKATKATPVLLAQALFILDAVDYSLPNLF